MNKKLSCVLLIDDDEFTNEVNVRLIKNMDVTEYIQVCNTGKDALNYITHNNEYKGEEVHYSKPDIIFLDINMPGMNGWEFLEEYKKLENVLKGNILIIMLTTSLNPDDEVLANGISGITEFRHKPMTKEMIDEIIQNYFPDKNSCI